MSEEVVNQDLENQGGENWFDTLSDDLKVDERITQIKDKGLNHLAKQYVESQKYVSGSVRIPGEEATEEDWTNYHNKIRPADYDEFKGKFQLKESEHANPEFQEAMTKKAHELGLTSRQVEQLANFQTDYVEQQIQEVWSEMDKNKEVSESQLKKEWGAAFDRNLSIVNRTVKYFGGEEVLEEIKSSSLGNNVGMIKMFYEVGKKLQEDKVIVDGDSSKLGRESAKEKLEGIMNDKSHPYWLKDGSDVHYQAVEEVQKLYELIYN